jgi:glyoxylase-like metal-dependent hydrolase (beta-lactamase superfamily II)/3-mercaptopyruvate sulfurtransferase SseA
MELKQFYLGCLAQASYLIGSDGEAAVIDPRRDVDEYLAEAAARGLRIKYVIETHLHADFVSGHRELSARAGAEIVFGKKAGAAFPHRAVQDGDELPLGGARLRFLETPGHTPESISVLAFERASDAQPRLVLTGDTLFIGDVGRPDLVGAKGHSPEAMAAQLFDSLHDKLLRLPDAVEVYPAHGAGSLCGKHMSKETSSTIGEQRRTNYALQPMSKDAFVKMMTADLPEVPQYFPLDVEMNRAGADPLQAPAPKALAPAEVQARGEAGAIVVDVRDAASYGAGHVPGSLNVALQGQFASWAGTLIPGGREIVIVADEPARVREATLRLARVGLERVAGYLDGGIEAWDKAGLPVAERPQVSVLDLHAWQAEGRAGLRVLDVRRPGEHDAGHVPGALSIPLDRLERELARVPKASPLAVICAGGYRSSAATSILERHGVADVVNVTGGTNAWVAAGYRTETSG